MENGRYLLNDKNQSHEKLVIHEYLVLLIYTLLWFILIPPLKFLSYLRPKLNRQFKDRDQFFFEFKNKAIQKDYVIFYCSSAGEYEQALPVIRRLQKRFEISSIIFFFSRSGYDFARIRGETTPFYLTPPDTWWHWHCVYQLIKPKAAFIIRHELWPGFILTTKTRCPVIVIDASLDEKYSIKSLRMRFYTWLLNQVSWVFVLAENNFEFYRHCGVKPSKMKVVGDTKYDRVIERALDTSDEVRDLVSQLFSEKRTRLIIGSAWLPEVHLTLPGLVKIQSLLPEQQWQLVIAPHDIGEKMIGKICLAVQNHQLTWQCFSQLNEKGTHNVKPATADVLLIDNIGLLAELYKNCELAFVGGGLDGRVHNVLEPACFGLSIAFGPQFKNSAEAGLMVEHKLAYVVKDQDDIMKWWLESAVKKDYYRPEVKKFTQQLAGSADRILDLLEAQLSSTR